MTAEDAIKILKEYSYYAYGIFHNEQKDEEAYDMAIEALSAEPRNKDAISRDGLLKSWEELSPRGRTEFDQVIMTIPSLPSAESRYMGCHGCVHYDQQQTALICHDCKRYYKDMYEDGEAVVKGADNESTL